MIQPVEKTENHNPRSDVNVVVSMPVKVRRDPLITIQELIIIDC